MEADRRDSGMWVDWSSKKREKEGKKGKPRYRSGVESLASRVEKKLRERYNWFRKKRNKVEDNDENEPTKREDKEKSSVKYDDIPKSVLFVQHTPESQLAKEIRKLINDLKLWTKIGINVVERAGERVQDILNRLW